MIFWDVVPENSTTTEPSHTPKGVGQRSSKYALKYSFWIIYRPNQHQYTATLIIESKLIGSRFRVQGSKVTTI
jgi:hypothetical protein